MRRISIPLIVIFLLLTLTVSVEILPGRAAGTPGSWMQTSKADFESGTLINLDTSTSPGDVMIASGGSTVSAGLPAVNRTSIGSGPGTFTLIENASSTAAPISGRITAFHVFMRGTSGTTQTKLKIFRDNGTHYLFVGESAVFSPVVGENSFLVTTPLYVHRGDLIGALSVGLEWASDQGSCGSSPYINGADVVQATLKTSWSTGCFNGAGGSLYSIEADILPTVTGSLVSSVKDTGGNSVWGTITWTANTTTGTSISFSTRTSNDFTNWSPWSANYTSRGAAITSPTGRFIQYRAVLAANGTLTPVLHDVTITYTTTSTTNVLLSLSAQSITPGSNITVSGMLSPSVSTTVMLTYVKPDGTSVNRTTSSNAQGFFSDSYAPDTSGTWKVRASSAAVSTIGAATSAYSTFDVQAGSSFLGTFLPWLILIIVVAGFGVAVLLTKPKTPKMG